MKCYHISFKFICIKIYAAYLLINTDFLEKFINGQELY